MPDYRVQLLHRLGFPVTKENLRFLNSWQAQEGGHTKNDARFNWLNTTKGSQYPSINSVGVRSFPNLATGIRYTADTLRNGRYPDILAGLKSGNPYAAPVADDLSVWVSGSPTKGLGYASKVLGKNVRQPKQSRRLAAYLESGVVVPQPTAAKSPEARQAVLAYFMASNQALMTGQRQPDFAPYAEIAKALRAKSTPPSPANVETTRRVQSAAKAANGAFLQAPTSWKATHPTDNLGWGKSSAVDIMSRPGTPVGAPEDGTLVRHGSAQGGESLYFKSDSGFDYWLGHIESDLPSGTRVRKGDVVASISSRHPRPHLHIDKRRL